MSYTDLKEIDESLDGLIQCNDCGATGADENMKHYDSCIPGESEKWERFYTEANTEIAEYEQLEKFETFCQRRR